MSLSSDQPWIVTDDGEIPGWYDYQPFWKKAIETAPAGSVLVEIGVFCGKSLIDIAMMAKVADKGLRVVGVDTFAGSEEHDLLSQLPKYALARETLLNLKNADVIDDVMILASDSAKAAYLFPHGSIHAVFIDAAHDEASVTKDIDEWILRVAPGGMIGGHDYHNFSGVKAAVDKRFPGIIVSQSKSWWEVGSNGPKKAKVKVVVLAYSGQVGGYVFDWCTKLQGQMFQHPNLSTLTIDRAMGYPTDVVRNKILKDAKDQGYDYCLMVDDDMCPDLLLNEPGTEAFLPTALSFALNHGSPCVVAAPYCSAPPWQEVLVMMDRQTVPDSPDAGGTALSKYTRDEAAMMTGIQRVAALPTGCMLIDTRVCDILPHPWFSYEYADDHHTKLDSTEDIVFSRNLNWLGVPQFCHWSAWAGHDKKYLTGKPQRSPIDRVPDSIYKAWLAGWRPEHKPR